jgi:hypothetical protein
MMRLHPGARRTMWFSKSLLKHKMTSGRTELGNELAVIPLWRLPCHILCHFLPSSMVSSLSGSYSTILFANLLLVPGAEIVNQPGRKKGS